MTLMESNTRGAGSRPVMPAAAIVEAAVEAMSATDTDAATGGNRRMLLATRRLDVNCPPPNPCLVRCLACPLCVDCTACWDLLFHVV